MKKVIIKYSISIAVAIMAVLAGTQATYAAGAGERVVVIFAETIDGQPDSTGIVESYVIEKLIDDGYDVIDREQAKSVLAEVGFERLYGGKMPPEIASFNADFILIGKVDSSFAGNVPGGWFGYLSDIQAKVISVSSAKILLATSAEGNGLDVTKPKSARGAATKGAQKLLKKVLPKLDIKLTDAPRNFVILLKDAESRTDVVNAMNKLKEIKGVTRVIPPSTMSGDVTRLDMMAKGYGSSFEFSGALEEAGFVIARSDGSRIELSLGGDCCLASFSNTPFNKPKKSSLAYLELGDLKVADIMPVKFQYYSTNPVGSVKIYNKSKSAAKNVSLELLIPKYTTLPAQKTFSSLKAGAELTVEFPLTFDNTELFKVEEDTPVQAEMKVSYNDGEEQQSSRMIVPLKILSRNTIDWSEEKPIVGFVTYREGVLDTFTKQIISYLGEEGVDDSLYRPMAIFDALAAIPLTYVKDAKGAIASRTIDYVQYPRETLQKRTGDCDDMSVVYASMLENVGIETALLTSPGHIFMAFNTGKATGQAEEISYDDSKYFVRDGFIWLPIEATAVKEGFASAWQRGAEEYNRASKTNSIGVIEVRQLQGEFPAVSLPPGAKSVDAPSKRAIMAKIDISNDAIADSREGGLSGRLASLKKRAESGDGDDINAYGEALAKAGELGDAEDMFEKIESGKAKAAALNNLGNLAVMNGDQGDAIDYYNEALEAGASSEEVNFNLGLAYYTKNEPKTALEHFRKSNIRNNPKLAERGKMLGMKESGRGADKVTKVYLQKLKSIFFGLLTSDNKKDGASSEFAVAGVRGDDLTEKTEMKYLLVWLR